MSFLGKKWIVKNTDQNKTPFEKILENRKIKDINDGMVFHDSFLFADMQKAVGRINEAVKNQERIIVFGDYDVDGISGAAILINTLKKLGANISYRLPHRVKDGYGLSEKFIDEFMEKKINIIITVDCGISCNKEIKKAKENNIDVIITDHHTIPEHITEDAFAILHPKLTAYPFKELTGAGVALKFAQALLEGNSERDFMEELITLASLGTIADLGILQGENRLIVKRGLENLLGTKSNGLQKLIQLAGIQNQDLLDTYTISFRIAPRINAAGRIGDPYIALSLLLQEEENEKVHSLGQDLEDLNIERQNMTEKTLQEAEAHFSNQKEIQPILMAESENWHVGILGLVATKLVEKYNRPAIIMQDLGETLIGSARSTNFLNITEMLTEFGEDLISFGGHAKAAGFNIKKTKLQEFKEKILKYAEAKFKNLELAPILEIDCELTENNLTLALVDELKQLEPFGTGNEKPVFLIKNVEPYFIDKVGREKNHLKFLIKTNTKNISVICFGMGNYAEELKLRKKIDFACCISKNVWNNKECVQLQALDIK